MTEDNTTKCDYNKAVIKKCLPFVSNVTVFYLCNDNCILHTRYSLALSLKSLSVRHSRQAVKVILLWSITWLKCRNELVTPNPNHVTDLHVGPRRFQAVKVGCWDCCVHFHSPNSPIWQRGSVAKHRWVNKQLRSTWRGFGMTAWLFN